MERSERRTMELWPHQLRALEQSRQLYKNREKSWCLVAPPGAGKSYIMSRIAMPAANAGKQVYIYAHRIMLTKQLVGVFEGLGAEVGVIAASQPDKKNLDCKIQICSVDTVYARMNKREGMDWPRADIIIVDELHANTESKCKAIYQRHEAEGAVRIGFTATPVGIGEVCSKLVNAGSYSEMLQCKAHLPIECYGPDRPNLALLKPMKGGDFSSEDDKRVNRVPTIFGRVYEYWQKLNPFAFPAVGFAPGVPESKWFVHAFMNKGVACAHIDAERTVFVEPNSAGELVMNEYPTDDSTRKEVIEGSENGKYKIIWNRFILREAIDCRAWYHCILATSMGAVSTYLQSTGRVLRYFEQYDHVILQDHSGNIDRHGLPNQERNWSLGCTNNSIHSEEIKKRQKTKGDEAEPICCPRCCNYRLHGQQCPTCGYMHSRSVRMVREMDGTLVKQTGRVVKYKEPKQATSDQDRWDKLFWAARNSNKEHPPTFKQMRMIFAKKYGYDLPANLSRIPKDNNDWGRKVKHTSFRDLR